MLRFSANLGLLWTDRPLPDAIRAAGAAGFDAVELHWPRREDAPAIRAALEDAGLPLLGLNSARGGPEEFGLSALPDRGSEARDAIDAAIAQARALGASHVHVMAGLAEGARARSAFEAALAHACATAPDLTILVEPINRHDVPGYFLDGPDLARDIIAAVAAPNLRLLFDAYHLARMGHDPARLLPGLLPLIGHVQIARAPDRGPPDAAMIALCHRLAALGHDRPVGAEYRPPGPTDASLGWLARARRQPRLSAVTGSR